MANDELKNYIEEKLSDLKREKDLTEVVHKGRLSFGLNEREYKHLPSWQNLVNNKKKLVRVFWSGCFLMSFTIVGIASNLPERLSGNWIEAIMIWIATSLSAMLLYVVLSYYSLFFHVRKTEHEVRKLIYEDILAKIKDLPQPV
ncbi:MAG: hypothetical protein ACXVBJ_02675 [Flavisolibacter sp.]